MWTNLSIFFGFSFLLRGTVSALNWSERVFIENVKGGRFGLGLVMIDSFEMICLSYKFCNTWPNIPKISYYLLTVAMWWMTGFFFGSDSGSINEYNESIPLKMETSCQNWFRNLLITLCNWFGISFNWTNTDYCSFRFYYYSTLWFWSAKWNGNLCKVLPEPVLHLNLNDWPILLWWIRQDIVFYQMIVPIDEVDRL